MPLFLNSAVARSQPSQGLSLPPLALGARRTPPEAATDRPASPPPYSFARPALRQTAASASGPLLQTAAASTSSSYSISAPLRSTSDSEFTVAMAESPEQDWSELDDYLEETKPSDDDDEIQDTGDTRRGNEKRRLREVSISAEKRGVCYLSRIPPRMDPSKLRQLLSRFGEVQRLYLVPEDPNAQVRQKQAGGFQRKVFLEGWVEFTKKNVAKKVANMLNGEQIGGKKKSSFYYDIWNIKYLSKFKWDDLTNETANNKRTKEQKRAMEIAAATRERDFYLKKVDQSRALKAIQERRKKKQKTQVSESCQGDNVEEPKVIRRFPQNQAVTDSLVQSKPRLSRDILAGVFGGGS